MQHDEIIKQNFKKLGQHIRKLREERKISLDEMSRETGIGKMYLQKIEKGTAYGMLFEPHLLKIADILNVEIIDLFQ